MGIPAFIAVAVVLPLAAFIYFSAPENVQNRRLGRLLAVEVMAVGLSQGLDQQMHSVRLEFANAVIFDGLSLSIGFLYLMFLATLQTPLVRPLATLAGTIALTVMAVAAGLLPTVRPHWAILVVDGGTTDQPAFILGFAAFYTLVMLYGLIVSISVFRRSKPHTQVRKRARAYLAAFGVRDGVFFLNFLIVIPLLGAGVIPAATADVLIPLIYSFTEIAFAALLAYGILRSQLFDLDLRIKAGLGRSAVLAAIAVTFFLVSELVEALLPVNGLVPGLIGAGLVTLAIGPVHRGATRVLDRLMPRVRDTPDYRDDRKHEVYAAALEDLARDGRLTDDDRRQLDALRARLGLGALPSP